MIYKKMTESFKTCVSAYCEIDDQLKTMNKSIKEYKVKQKELSEEIMDYMSSNSIEVCNAGNYGVLTLKSTIVKGSLNKDCIKDNLCKFISQSRDELASQNPEDLAENGAEYILNNRPTETRNSLRRSSPKT